MDIKYEVFLVSEVLMSNLRRPDFTFIEKDYNAAKLHFKAFLECEKSSCKRHGKLMSLWQLHSIGKIDKTFTYKPQLIYITDSYALTRAEEIEASQLQINLQGRQMADRKVWNQTIEYRDKIKQIFGGKNV